MSPATPKTTVHRPAIRTTVSSPELETPLGSSGPKAPGHTLELNTAISARALSVRDLSVDFTTAQGPLRAIDRVSFDLAPGEVLALVGESGSGKSVTARALLGLTDPVTQSVGGAVLLEGESLLPLSQAAWRSRRGRRIALILQDPMTCRGAICHILIDIQNKTNSVQKLQSIPNLVTSTGTHYGPADANRMGNGSNYCRPKVDITLQPHELARDIGICSQDIPPGTAMTLAELRDSSGALVVSGVFKATAY